MAGRQEPHRRRVRAFIESFIAYTGVESFTADDALLDVKLRGKLFLHQMTIDRMIAAMAIGRSWTVVTTNRRDFAPYVDLGLKLTSWTPRPGP